ncbi:MAG: hypothetical protein ACOC42_01400 [Halobacteriota archaeon]
MPTAEAEVPRGDPERVRAVVERVVDLPDATIRHLCGESFALFANVVTYNWLEGNDRYDWPGQPATWYPLPDHFMFWHERVHTSPLNMMLAARKHTKTTYVSCLMLHRSEYTPGHTSLYWANTEGQVEERMEEFDDLIDANGWLRNAHTDTALKRKTFANNARIRTTWVEGAAEGGHVDLSIGDDPMKELGDIPDTEVEAWYGNVIVPMLNVEGTHMIFGTRKRPTDLYELLRAKHETDDALAGVDLPNYRLTEFPAVREPWLAAYPGRTGDLAPAALYTPVEAPMLARALGIDGDTVSILWPDGRPVDWLATNLGGQGRPYFLREYCMVYVQATDALIERAWLDACTADRDPPARLVGEAWQPADHGEAVDRDWFDEVAVGIDPAGTGRDLFGFVTVGQATHDIDGEAVDLRHVLDVYAAEQLPPSAFREKFTALEARYRPDVFGLESNLNQTWVAEDEAFPASIRERIEPIRTTRRKHAWTDGVPAMASDIEAGRYRFYAGQGDLADALTALHMDDGALVGQTPDLVMALWMADRALRAPRGVPHRRVRLDGDVDTQSAEAREREASLRGSPIGDALLRRRDRMRGR